MESKVINYSNSSFLNEYKNIVKKAKNQLFNAFIKNPYKYFESYLFDSDYFENIFSFFERAKIKMLMVKLDREAARLLKNGAKTDEEDIFLLKYLSQHINLDDDRQRELVDEILRSNYFNDINEKNLYLII